jgi:hypothetical protein
MALPFAARAQQKTMWFRRLSSIPLLPGEGPFIERPADA